MMGYYRAVRRPVTLLATTAISGFFSIGAAFAQDTTVLDPIVVEAAGDKVTDYRAERSSAATFTDTPLRDVPQTVNVVGRQELRDKQAATLTQALEAVPNFTAQSSAGNRSETFLLRGFRRVSYSVDGMAPNAALDRPELLMDPAAIERIEVLKGPASVLFGAGEPGGTINVVTRKPSAETGADADVSVGSFGFKRAEGSVTGALDAEGQLTGRLTAAAQEEDGWIKGRPGSERQYFGGALEWTPFDTTRFSLSADHTRAEQPFDRGLIWVPQQNRVLEPYDTWLGEDWSMVDAHKTRINAKVEHDLTDDLTLRAAVAFEDGLSKDNGIDYISLGTDGRTLSRRYHARTEDTLSHDARLEALWKFDLGTTEHELLAGTQYSWSEMDFKRTRVDIDPIDIFDPVHDAPRPVGPLNDDYTETVRNKALYLQDQITFSEEWKALAGLRWDRSTSGRDARRGTSLDETTNSAVTGRLGVVWQPRTDLSLYASVAQSFNPQSGYDRDGNSLAPEKGIQYEIGAKWDVVPDRLTTTLALFEITKKNVATSDPSDPSDPDADYSILAGEQRSRGIELDVAGEILPGWTAHAGIGYAQAIVTEDNEIAVGNRLAGVPYLTGSLWTSYTLQSGQLEGLTVGGGLTHVGSRYIDLNNREEVDSYTRLDMMASYKMESGPTISLKVNNVTDIAYIQSAQGVRDIVPGVGRNAQLRMGWEF